MPHQYKKLACFTLSKILFLMHWLSNHLKFAGIRWDPEMFLLPYRRCQDTTWPFWWLLKLFDNGTRIWTGLDKKKLQHGQMTIKPPEVPATFQSNQTKNNWLMRQAQRLHVTKMLYPIIVFDFLCKLFPEREEAINHVTAESKMFTQQYCLWQHDGAVAVVHLMMCKRYGFPTGTK